MSFVNLRDFIHDVEQRGEFLNIKGAHWDLEMGGIVELKYRDGNDPKPLILFDEVVDYSKGFRNMFGMLGSCWRIARTLGLPGDEIMPMQVHENWFRKQKEIKQIPPTFIDSGPIFENTDTDDKINVLKFPVPKFHEHDGGRYIGTAHAVIQQDPDTGWLNLGTYRIMVIDHNHLALHATVGKHGNIIAHKYFSRKQTMPIAIAIGMSPALWWTSCQGDTPWGYSEYDYAGGITGKPIEVIKGPYSNLPIPAHAEIVIEGECHHDELANEGPFGEWHGYYANLGNKPVPEPVIKVKAVHYRDDPILTCSQPAVPPHTFTLFLCVAHSVAIRKRLEAYGIPGIKGIWSHFTGSGGLFNVISLEQLYSGHAQQAGLVASQFPVEMGSFTVIVDEDIDPSNLEQVLWATVTRTRLDRQISVIPDCPANNVHPAISPKDKMNENGKKPITAARVIVNACRDFSWKDEWYPIAKISPELKSKLMEKWKTVLSDVKQ